MPRGRYLVAGEVEEFACAAGPAGWRYTGVRRESGRTVDLTLDSRGRPHRVELASPDWVLRGGAVGDTLLWVRRPARGDLPGTDLPGGELTRSGLPDDHPGGDLAAGEPPSGDVSSGDVPGADQFGADLPGHPPVGVSGELRGGERSAVAQGFAADSPAFCVAVARLLRLPVGAARRVRLVEVSWPALATRVVDVEWRHVESVRHPADAGPLVVSRYQAVPLDTGEARTVHLAGDVVVAADGVELLDLDAPPTNPDPRPTS